MENRNKEMLSYKNRESSTTNAAMEFMASSDNLQDESFVGCFWYDNNKNELYGVVKTPAEEIGYYHSLQWNKDVKTAHTLHEHIWNKQFHRGKDSRFKGDYTQKPRGRVFEFKDEGFMVFTGSWINDYPEAKDEIMFEFQLPKDNTTFVQDEHWDIGHGWSNEF